MCSLPSLVVPIGHANFMIFLNIFSSEIAISLTQGERESSVAHPYQRLAEILSLQQAHERCRRVFDAVGYVLAIADASVGNAAANRLEEIGIVLRDELGVDETAERQALGQNLAHGCRQEVRPAGRTGCAVLRDQSTDRDARVGIEQRQSRLPNRTADILKIDVDAFRAGRR